MNADSPVYYLLIYFLLVTVFNAAKLIDRFLSGHRGPDRPFMKIELFFDSAAILATLYFLIW